MRESRYSRPFDAGLPARLGLTERLGIGSSRSDRAVAHRLERGRGEAPTASLGEASAAAGVAVVIQLSTDWLVFRRCRLGSRWPQR